MQLNKRFSENDLRSRAVPANADVQAGDPSAESYMLQHGNFGPVIRRWEYLRLAYNILLVTACLLYTAIFDPANFADPEFWVFLAIGAAIANLCYMAGPAVDGYLTWFGVWTAPIASLLFMAGTFFTAYMALSWISRY